MRQYPRTVQVANIGDGAVQFLSQFLTPPFQAVDPPSPWQSSHEMSFSAYSGRIDDRGAAYMAVDPIVARDDLQAAFELFERAHDAVNQLTALAGIISSHFIQDSSMSAYAGLIEAMAARFAPIGAWPDASVW